MTAERTKTAILLILFSCALSCSGTPLTAYAPGNQDEKKIITLLLAYEDAKINCDLDRYLACLHEKGTFHFGRGYMVSKEQLRQYLPAFWAGLQSGSRIVYPMNREMITGNYVLTGRFYNPNIRIEHNTADVTMTFMKWGWPLRHFVSLHKEDDQWLITRLDWEEN